MADKQKTLWPLGILLVIALGVVLISVSIYISSTQSIDTDGTFNMKKTDLDEEINAIMKKQNEFESIYKVHISTIGNATHTAPLMRSPYYVGGVPRDIPTNEGALHKGGQLSIFIQPNTNAALLGSPNAIVIPEFSITRLDQGEKKANKQKITPALESIGKHSKDSPIHATFLADMPQLQKPGFYQVRLHAQVIEYNPDSYMQPTDLANKTNEDKTHTNAIHKEDKLQVSQKCLILENDKAKLIDIQRAPSTQNLAKDSRISAQQATQDSHNQAQNAAKCLNYSVLYEGYFYHWIFNTEENVSSKTQANNEDLNAEQQEN